MHVQKKKERKWKATDLMICSVDPTAISANSYYLNECTAIAFTVQCNAFLIGIHLNIEKIQANNSIANDSTAIENLILRIEPQDDRDTDKFIVPFSECVAEKYIKLYPSFWIKLSKYTKYTMSIGFDCSKKVKGTNSFCYNKFTINQKKVTNNYSQLSFAEIPLLVLHRDMFDDNQIVCGFCMTFS